jgi:hypothetical protein
MSTVKEVRLFCTSGDKQSLFFDKGNILLSRRYKGNILLSCLVILVISSNGLGFQWNPAKSKIEQHRCGLFLLAFIFYRDLRRA